MTDPLKNPTFRIIPMLIKAKLISTNVGICSTHENQNFLEVAGPNHDHYQGDGLYRKGQTIPET